MAYPFCAQTYARQEFGLETRMLVSVRAFVLRSLEGLEDEALEAIVLATDEAVANAIEHAHAPRGATLELVVYRERDHIRLIMTHPGVTFAGTCEPIDLEAHRRERRRSGLGLHLMGALLDRVWFRTTRDGEQQVVLIKQLG